MEISNISIIGAGTMGVYIGSRVATHGYEVCLYDVDKKQLENAEQQIRDRIKNKEVEQAIGREKRMLEGKKAFENISYHNDLEKTVKDADIVIEAIPENLELKKEIFSKIEEFANPETIIATNSSSIPISDIEDAVNGKDRVMNIHFYAGWPMADIMRGTETSDQKFEKGEEWVKSIGCEPLVVKKECYGFVFNRVWRAVKKECLKIWAGGDASIEDVDKAWKIFTGMNIGPFELMDHVGLDVVYDIEMSYYRERDNPDDKPPHELKDKVEDGELGEKSGKGFYKWENGEPVEAVE